MTGTRRAGPPSGRQLLNAIDRDAGLDVAEHYVMSALVTRFYDWTDRAVRSPDHGDGRPPSITEIQAKTKYRSRTTIKEALFRLEDLGWLTRRPPPAHLARTQHVRTAYVLHLPGSEFAEQTRAEQTGPDHHARRRAWAELVRAAVARKAAAAAGPGAWWDSPELRTAAAAALQREAGGRQLEAEQLDELAAAAVAEILAPLKADKIRTTPAAYVAGAIRKHPERYLPSGNAPPPAAEVLAAASPPPAEEPRPAGQRIREIIAEQTRARPIPRARPAT